MRSARRILLLTFTRRAAAGDDPARAAHRGAGARRATPAMRGRAPSTPIANRLLRRTPAEVGLDPGFTLLDREDGADLIDRLRHEQGLARTIAAFRERDLPRYLFARRQHQAPLRDCLRGARFPGASTGKSRCARCSPRYVDAKQHAAGARLRRSAALLVPPDERRRRWRRASARRFDHVLVDEYQDTNALQAEILRGLRPTVAASRSSATTRSPSTRSAPRRSATSSISRAVTIRRRAIVTLEQNYRSTHADPRRRQRGDRRRGGALHQESVARRAPAARARAGRRSPTSRRNSTTSSSASSSCARRACRCARRRCCSARRTTATCSRSSSAAATSRS